MVHIRPTLPGDSWLILANLRQAEIDELAALGVTAEQNMRFGLLHGDAQTVFINDEPAGIFGVMRYESHSEPWGVFSTVIDRYPVAFLRATRRWMREQRGPLSNCVDARNERAVKWFAWLGFEISDPVPFGLKGELFRTFRVN